jgi:hypothetical protein
VRLPRGASAVVDHRKVVDYLLSRDHPVGRNKARVFERALGLTSENADFLVVALLEAAIRGDAVLTASDRFGDRYKIDFVVDFGGRRAGLRSAWLVPAEPSSPMFLTAFVL